LLSAFALWVVKGKKVWMGCGSQFSAEEIKAVVEEAKHAGTYVCAHAYTANAVKRVLELGVQSIEHGNVSFSLPFHF
jgi:imidazolonepropionase-like amidohydrolase